MTRIKQYKLTDNINVDDILNNGFKYHLNKRYLSKFITLKGSIILLITISLDDIYSFDFYDNTDVLDDDFCQPYMPFYDNYNNDIVDSGYLADVVNRYNEELSNISIFKEVV